MLPLFKKSEKNLNFEGLNRKYHGVDGEQSISRYPYSDPSTIMMVEALHEGGLPIQDYNAENQIATIQAQTYSQDGIRVSANNAFIEPIRYKRRNLIIRTNSEVFKILIDKTNVAYGVKYIRHGKIYTAFAKKEVILSAGSINTPKLLMLSGIGPKEHLSRLNIHIRQDSAVGENLQDHTGFFGLMIGLPNKTSTRVDHEEVLQEVYEYSQMKYKHGPMAANGPVNVGAFLKSDPHLPAPDIQIGFHYLLLRDALTDPVTFDRVKILPTGFYDGVYPRIQTLTPKSRGKLLLNATNPHGKPLIYANYFEDPNDMIPMIIGARYFISLENTKAFKSRGASFVRATLPACKGYAWGSDEYIVCLIQHYTFTIYHPVGTCKMGPKTDRKAVVDPRLRVYGISGLRVIDASIMPLIVRGNTNAATFVIGENGANFIWEEWTNHY